MSSEGLVPDGIAFAITPMAKAIPMLFNHNSSVLILLSGKLLRIDIVAIPMAIDLTRVKPSRIAAWLIADTLTFKPYIPEFAKPIIFAEMRGSSPIRFSNLSSPSSVFSSSVSNFCAMTGIEGSESSLVMFFFSSKLVFNSDFLIIFRLPSVILLATR